MNEREVKNSLLVIYPEFEKVYGPYLRKDGRKHVVLHNSSGKNKTISWPKAIVEAGRGESLGDNETVDHIDRDFTNDSLENLQVLKRPEHARKDVAKRNIGTVACPICLRQFTPTADQIATRNKRHSGPYCSRACAGKSTHIPKAQRGERTEPERIYFR